MTNRGMIRRTFDSMGLEYVSELALLNCQDLLTILCWNERNGIKFFRVSSDLFPWMSEYEINQLPHFHKIAGALKAVGDYATKNNHRLTFHPGPFNKLASPKDSVVDKTLKELNQHSQIFDLMGFSPSHYNKINIHVGGAYGDREATAKLFCKNFDRLDANTKLRLTVENDDRPSLFSTSDLYNMVHKFISIPIVHDFHHHIFRTGDMSQREALELAISTWGDVTPVVHYSESRSIEKADPKIKSNAHSDYINGPIITFGHNVDIMIEAKRKEQALLRLRNKDGKIRLQ